MSTAKNVGKYSSAVLVGAMVMGGIWWLQQVRAGQCTYELINPTRCNEKTRYVNPGYQKTETAIQSIITEEQSDGLTTAAVSFRDLRNGPTFSLNNNQVYLAGSLYKLPVMMRYLKDAQSDDKLLSQNITVHLTPLDAKDVQNLPSDQTIEDGHTYTVKELLRRMISYSDNNSLQVLINFYHEMNPRYDVVEDTLVELGVSDPIRSGNPNAITSESLALIFRLLYNASFLDSDMSNLALTWMSQSSFHQGINAPIPKTITVANKFGYTALDSTKQLHDCGIVYYPDHPYILCVMTQGSNQPVLIKTIAKISQEIYNEVSQRFTP